MLPRSLFPEHAKAMENVVWLTAREHFVCHWIATKMFLNSMHTRKMTYAFGMFLNHNRFMQRSMCSRQFELSKVRYRSLVNEVGAHNRGKPRAPEFIQAMSNRQRGKKLSEETKARMSIRKKGSNNKMFGTHLTAETKAKISQAAVGRTAHNKGTKMSDSARTSMMLTKRNQANKYEVRRVEQFVGVMTIVEFCEIYGYKYRNAYGSIVRCLKYFDWTFVLI